MPCDMHVIVLLPSNQPTNPSLDLYTHPNDNKNLTEIHTHLRAFGVTSALPTQFDQKLAMLSASHLTSQE